MAFVMPAGDYERALRLASASNFMEALEAGVDRGMRRQAMRESSARARELYDRQKALESANLQAELEKIGEGAFTAQQAGRMAATPTVTSGSSVPIATQAAVQAVAQDIAQDAAGAAPAVASPTAAALADAVAPAPAVAVQAPQNRRVVFDEGSTVVGSVPQSGGAAGTPIPQSTLPSQQTRVETRIKNLQDAWEGTPDIAERIRIEDELKELLIGQKQLAWYETNDVAQRLRLEDEIRSLQGVEPEGAEPEGPLLGPELPSATSDMTDERRAQLERLDAAPPVVLPSEGPVADAARQQRRSTLGLPTALPTARTAGATISATAGSRQKALDEYRMAEAAHKEALRKARGVAGPSLLGGLRARGDKDVQATKARLDEAARAYKLLDSSVQEQASTLERALAADASYQSQVRGDLAPSLDNRELELGADVGRARTDLERALDALSIPQSEEADSGSALEQLIRGAAAVGASRVPGGVAGGAGALALGPAALMAAQQASEGTLPGAGAMAGVNTADQRMSGAVRGEPTNQATQQEQRRLQGIEENALGAGVTGDLLGATSGTPLEQAVSQQAAVAEQAELAGPEPEAVKADQTVDVAGKVYTVKKGDTLGRVSSSFGAPLASVVAANQDVLAPGGKPRQIKRGGKVVLEGQDLIYAGDKIRIPTGEGRESGGEAGPIDPRPVPTTTGPGGQVTSSEGVLARVQRANKTNAQVKAALEKEQQKTPDLPLNPFQKFGRSIDYTPSVRAVAFATQRAQQGDFTMLNQMAGREVRYSELPGLFARYSDFVLGAKGRAKEVYLQQELLKETQANEAKQRALVGVQAMALTQFRRAGYTDEDAQVFAGHYADLYAADPQQARAWSTSLNSMGTDRAKAEAARLKRSGFGGTSGFSSKDINKAYNIVDKAQGRLTSAIGNLNRALAPGGIPLPLEDMKKAALENPGLIASMTNYERALKTYNNADKRLSQMLNEGVPEGSAVSLDELLERYDGSKAMKREVAKARRGEIGWDGFEAELSKLIGANSAKALAEHYKTTEAKDAPEAEAAAPSATTSPVEARSTAVIGGELSELMAKAPASRQEARSQRSRVAGLRREGRSASLREMREALAGRANRVTGDAEDMLIRVNAGEAVPSSDRQSAVSSLKSLLSDLETFESQGAEEGGSVGLNPFDNRVGIIALRRGVPVSEDIEDVKFLIKRLSR